MIIDCRLRPPYKGFLDLHLFRGFREVIFPERLGYVSPLTIGRIDPPSFHEQTRDNFMREMDAAGIDVAMVAGSKSEPPYGRVSNDDVYELTQDYPGRFVPLAGIDPYEEDPVGELQRCLGDLGFKGFTMNVGWVKPPLHEDDERLFPIYQKCQEMGGIFTITKSMLMGPDFSWGRPEAVVHVARAFPAMQIVVIHGGFPYVVETLAAAFACANIWISPDVYGYIPNTPGAHEFVRAAHYYLGDRLLFGSCYPIWSMGQAVDSFREMGFRPDVLEKAFHHNPARLLGLKV
jgi:predicted TIM-barrel fold metal-dependent hydrolase